MDDSPDFVRQRRNLILVSIVLIFAELTDLSLEKLSILGNDLRIGKPQNINSLLWVVGVYLLWRYYQQLRSADVWRGMISAIRSHRSGAIVKLLAEEVMRRYQGPPGMAERGVKPLARVDTYRPSDVERVWRLDASVDVVWEVTPTPGEATIARAAGYAVSLPPRALLATNARSFAWVAFNTHWVTEIFVPLLLFAAAIFCALYQRIAG